MKCSACCGDLIREFTKYSSKKVLTIYKCSECGMIEKKQEVINERGNMNNPTYYEPNVNQDNERDFDKLYLLDGGDECVLL